VNPSSVVGSAAAFLGLAPRSTPSLGTAGQLIYAVGDIHGRYDLLTGLLAGLLADSEVHARGRRPVLVFCGDYVDRGPDSAKVIESLLWLARRPEFDVRLLKGNHEEAMLAFVEAPEHGVGWLKFGGDETLRSYGVTLCDDEPDVADCFRARDDLLERMPSSHLRLLQGLDLMLTVGGYAFVHAGIRPGIALADQREDDLLWIREDFIEHEGPYAKRIVHGHTWVADQPAVHPHRIGIDTGAYATGVLTAVRLDGETVDFIRALGPDAEV
jgi:serine/threonine protein phosphatase 1